MFGVMLNHLFIIVLLERCGWIISMFLFIFNFLFQFSGETKITNHKTGDSAKIKLRKCGWFGKGQGEVEAWILDSQVSFMFSNVIKLYHIGSNTCHFGR